MSATGISRIEMLTKDNYDTWKIQMEALLVKCDLWDLVSGEMVKPDGSAGVVWDKNDRKAKSEIILAIGSTEIKHVKNCITFRDVWCKLESIYQSKGPARKAALLTKLTLSRMQEGSDIREHLNNFFDAVDKLANMDIVINQELLSILLLNSLSASYKTFRCAMKSGDDLPDPDNLRVKIIEESDARDKEASGGAMIASKKYAKNAGDNSKQKKKPIKSLTNVC